MSQYTSNREISRSNNITGNIFGGEDSKSCFSTPKRITRQYANPPSLKKKKSILDDKKEISIESPEGKEILNDPGEVKEVDGKTIVFDKTNLNAHPWKQVKYIVLPDTNPLTNTVIVMYSDLIREREKSRETENRLMKEIKNVQEHSLGALAKQKYVLKKNYARKNYIRKRRRITTTTNLDVEFSKATGYSNSYGTFGSNLFK